jgi:predicted PurR-regulated permease PerM
MIAEHESPCEALKELQQEVKKHGEELAKASTNFAVINTKLNLIIGIMVFIGTAVGGVVVSILFS